MLTAGLVYLVLHYLFVRPMRRLTASMVGFHENPESAARIIVPSQRSDEIGVAERELSDMQRDLVSMLRRRAGSPRSASPSPRSTTICAICWRRRNYCPTSSPACPTRGCSALRRS